MPAVVLNKGAGSALNVLIGRWGNLLTTTSLLRGDVKVDEIWLVPGKAQNV